MMSNGRAALGRDIRRSRAVRLGMVVVAGCAFPGAGSGQDLLTASDVVRLPSPAPAHVIPYGEHPLQFGHLRLPPGPGPHPVLVFLHGGCFLSQYDIRHVGALEQAVADAGFAVWSLEYRRVGDDGAGWPSTFRDVARGADHVRTLAADHYLDLDRAVAGGHSAGGALALWLAARKRLTDASPLYVRDPLEIHGVFAMAPAPDLEGMHTAGVCGGVIDRLMGGSPAEVPERYAQVSPMQLTPIDVTQVLVIGRHDRSWAPVGRAYHERAVAAGARAIRSIEAPESGHFEMIVPSTVGWDLVVESLRALFHEVSPAGRRSEP